MIAVGQVRRKYYNFTEVGNSGSPWGVTCPLFSTLKIWGLIGFDVMVPS